MQNKRMEQKLQTEECLDVEKFGLESEPGVYEITDPSFSFENKDLCVGSTEQWIWSVGRNREDGRLYAATDGRFYENAWYECLWLR